MRNPPDPDNFYPRVWLIVQQIPPGKVATYGQIASMLPAPEGVESPEYDRLGAQWVGQAMNRTPGGQGIPWQRVLGAKGMITIAPGSAAAAEQRALLEAEGVIFDDKNRIDFEVYGWEGPPEDWLREHGLYQPFSLKKGGSQPKLF
jgi:methylated-DNA-protein-cysteine methyltransferase-like protein